jgi:hypothetical protein
MTTPIKTLRVLFATYVKNNGDGSVSVQFYPDEETAELVAEKHDERFGEDIRSHELEIDADTGEIVSGLEVPVESEDGTDANEDDEDE